MVVELGVHFTQMVTGGLVIKTQELRQLLYQNTIIYYDQSNWGNVQKEEYWACALDCTYSLVPNEIN